VGSRREDYRELIVNCCRVVGSLLGVSWWPNAVIKSVFHFPSVLQLRNLKNVEKAAISCVFEVDC
jgi:hypothetical protein